MKILIIEDNPADRAFYKKNIEECNLFENMEVEESENLSQAFECIEVIDFDLIILDLGLPESDGIQTVIKLHKELQKKEKMPPIIVLTGLEDHIVGAEAFRHGVKDFLTKGEVLDNSKELSRSIKYATYSLNFSE